MDREERWEQRGRIGEEMDREEMCERKWVGRIGQGEMVGGENAGKIVIYFFFCRQ